MARKAHLIIRNKIMCGKTGRHIGGVLGYTPDEFFAIPEDQRCAKCNASKTAAYILKQRENTN